MIPVPVTDAAAVVDALGQGLGDAKVGDQGVPVREEYVVRLDVAVHDPTGVRVRQRLGHLAYDAHRFVDW
jgi:hypothetical protein